MWMFYDLRLHDDDIVNSIRCLSLYRIQSIDYTIPSQHSNHMSNEFTEQKQNEIETCSRVGTAWANKLIFGHFLV